MQRISEHELERMLPGRELERRLRLPEPEVPNLIGRWQRQVVRGQLRDVDEQVMMTGVRRRYAGRRYAHAAETELDRDRRGHLGAVRGRNEVDLGARRRGRARQSSTACTLLRRRSA
jgi:hypothetical protein